MMRKIWRTEAPQWAIITAMFMVAAAVWRQAPDTLPVHWGLNGEADRFGGKVEGLLLPPLLALGVYLLMLVLPRVDPGRANYANFRGAYTFIRYAVLLVFVGVYAATLLVGVGGWQIDIGRVALMTVGGMLLATGGTLGKLRPNWFVGIRTPWTLSSKRAWSRTHRLGGWLFVALGVVWMLSALGTSPLLRVVPLLATGASVAALFVYSYWVWRNDKDRTPPAGTLPIEQR
jgi:uncharacterized membrane protein